MAIHYVRLGQNIRAARNKIKMTQRAAVEELSINSVEHYSHLECGNRRVQLETLDDICKLYNVSYEELLKGATDAKIIASDGADSGNDNERRFAAIVADCPQDVVELILEMCRQAVTIWKK